MQNSLIAIQCVALLILAFVPFGFDHPSPAGLDFDDFLACAAVYVVAPAGGSGVAVLRKRWWLAVVQVIGGVIVAAVFFCQSLVPANGKPQFVEPAEQVSSGIR